MCLLPAEHEKSGSEPVEPVDGPEVLQVVLLGKDEHNGVVTVPTAWVNLKTKTHWFSSLKGLHSRKMPLNGPWDIQFNIFAFYFLKSITLYHGIHRCRPMTILRKFVQVWVFKILPTDDVKILVWMFTNFLTSSKCLWQMRGYIDLSVQTDRHQFSALELWR